jgi:hypothetical protein
MSLYDGCAEFFWPAWLLEKATYLGLVNGTNSRLDSSVPGEKHSTGVRKLARYDGQELAAAHSGHALVGYHHVDFASAQNTQRFVARVRL